MSPESLPYEVIDRIADLILQDPSISVREVARRLGYAEAKTIYYWLSKRGFHDIRPFKRVVLTGQYRHVLRAGPDSAKRAARLPVADRLSPQGDPLYTGATVPVALDRGRGLYVPHSPGPPDLGVLTGDYLVVGPLALEEAEVVLVQTEALQLELRHVLRPAPGQGPFLFDYRRAAFDDRSRPRATVLQVMRVLKPAIL